MEGGVVPAHFLAADRESDVAMEDLIVENSDSG